MRRAQVFVEALIVEVTSDKAAEFGIQWQVLTGAIARRTGVQGIGGTNFGARGSGTNIIDASINLGSLGPGPQPRHHQRLDHHPRPRRHQQPRPADPRARERRQGEHPVDADAAHARQRGSAHHRRPERAVHHRPVRDDRHDGDRAAVPDDRAARRRPRAAREAADHRGRHRAAAASTRKSRACRTRRAAPGRSCRSARSNRRCVVDDQQIVVLGGLIQDTFTDSTDKVPYAGDVPVFGALFRYDTRARHEDEPDGVPEADGRAHARATAARSRRSATTTCAASR